MFWPDPHPRVVSRQRINSRLDKLRNLGRVLNLNLLLGVASDLCLLLRFSGVAAVELPAPTAFPFLPSNLELFGVVGTWRTSASLLWHAKTAAASAEAERAVATGPTTCAIFAAAATVCFFYLTAEATTSAAWLAPEAKLMCEPRAASTVVMSVPRPELLCEPRANSTILDSNLSTSS